MLPHLGDNPYLFPGAHPGRPLSSVEAAYRRGDLFTKCRQMMQDWADYVSNKQPEEVPLNRHA